ncbi:hypothetical protein ACTXGU_00175 [Niallia sp. 01092]|uniref:hypothetical protein n=1 Tax=Niallia sp. 01092 TaxID=3457759 RepID=UPI003FD0BBCD
MKKYAKGTHLVYLTDKAYETIYKDLGYLEVISSKYERSYLETLSYRGLYALYSRNGLVEHMASHMKESKEEMIKQLELIEIRFNTPEESVEQSVLDELNGDGVNNE